MSDTRNATAEERRGDPSAVLLVDAAGDVLNADEVAERLLGRSAEDICSLRVTDLFLGLVKENEFFESVVSDSKVRRCFALTGDGNALAVELSVRRFLGRTTSSFLLTFKPDGAAFDEISFHHRVLDSVDAITAVIDERGIIVYVNDRWREFAQENGGELGRTGIGTNYLAISESAAGNGDEGAKELAHALQGLLAGRRAAFHSTNPYHALALKRWFQVRARMLVHGGRTYIVISHESIDELKQFEVGLAMKSAKLVDAAHLANLGYFVRNLQLGPDIEWSVEAARIAGRDSMVTSSIDDFYSLVHPEDRLELRQIAAVAIQEKSQFESSYRILRDDGETRWIHFIARPDVRNDGKVERYFGVLQDVTSHVAIRAELEQSQAQFRDIFELAQDGIAVIDLDAKISTTNPRFREIMGIGEGVVAGRTIYEFLEPSSADLIRRRFASRIRGEFVEPIVTLELADKTRRTVRTSLRQIGDVNGVPTGAILFATDLSEVVDARSALDLTMVRFHRALEMTNTLVSDQDTNLRFVRVYNGHFYRDPIGKRDDELLSPDCAPAIVQLKQGVIETGKSARRDVMVIRGEVKSYFDLGVYPQFDESGRVSGITCVAVDITDRVNAEVARQEHNASMFAELEAKNQALEAARYEADQANIAKSRFLAMMSHEIRTPLNGVLGMTGVLLDMLQDSAQREIVETIRTSGDSLLTIINDILDFSKIEAGLMELEEHPFAIRHCFDDVIDLIGPQARRKFIELVFVVAPDVPVGVIGDVTRLRQVLVNLIGNATKFTDAGEIVVEVKIGERLAKDELTLHFAVRDTGIGIAAERMGRLFQTFSQVDVSINRKYGGTGLGLAICKRLVELMNGRIWVESTPGVGTTFHFTIATRVAPDVKSDVLEAIAIARCDLEGKRVLVVDDNATTRAVLAEQLQTMGIVPVTVSSAKQALERLRQDLEPRTVFTAVFIDLEMPESDGYQLMSWIRSDPRLFDRPLVLLTASDTATSQVRKQWQAPCLSKPVKISTLFESIMRVVLDSPHLSSHGPRSIPIDSSLGTRHPLRILLAEDNVINQKVALLLLERAGYRADIAANGSEVLDAVTTKAYDLIFMDVQMPEMDGIEATRRLRGPGPWLGKPRIVAMTADVMQEGREACLAVGMDDFVAKPIRIPELMRTLERCAVQKNTGPGSEDGWMAGTEAQLLTADDVIVDEGAFAALRSVCELEGEGALASLVSEFITDSRRMLDEMAALVGQGAAASMERLAHTLKGTSGAFGAVGFSRRMEVIEKACREKDDRDLAPVIEASRLDYVRLVKALEQLCAAR